MNNERLIELKEIKPTRTNLQNRALHLFFNMISDELNNLGLEFRYAGLVSKEIAIPYTWLIVKDRVWRPIQITLFDIESTKEINTEQINKIADVLIKFFGERGISISFPNIQDYLHKKDAESL